MNTEDKIAPAAPLPAQPEALATITLGGIEGDELGNIDIEIIDMKRLEALQYQMVSTEDPVYLHLYALAGAAPLPELTGPSIEQIEMDIIENWLMEMSQPIGMDCCGQYGYTDHGLLGTEAHCCGNGEPAFMDFAAFEKRLNERREVLIASLSAASPSPAPAQQQEPKYAMCNDHGSVGRAPDDYYPCPGCSAETATPGASTEDKQ